jgi:hypothetical protein
MSTRRRCRDKQRRECGCYLHRRDRRIDLILHVGSLRRSGSGIAIIDEFTVAHGAVPGIKAIGIDGENAFHTYVACRRDLPLCVYAP